MTEPEMTQDQADDLIDSKPFVILLVAAAIVGLVVSLAAWAFLTLVANMNTWVFSTLPKHLGFDSEPTWWPAPVLVVAGVLVALAVGQLPGRGGHVPAHGLAAGGPPSGPELIGVVVAGVASVGLGVVLGPEAPLMAIGGGLALLLVGLVRRETPPELPTLMVAVGAFSALTALFGNPIPAAIIIVEILAIGGPKLRLVLIPALLGAGVGTIVTVGFGSWTGLSSNALPPLKLPAFDRPDVGDFAWSILLAIAIAAVGQLIMHGGIWTERIVEHRLLRLLPLVGLVIAILAIAFGQITGHGQDEVLFSGQDQLPGLVEHASTWSLGALSLLILFKGVAYALSLGSFRGGPTFPAVFLGAAAGIMASHLPGYSLTPAVAVGIAAGTVAILRLPWTAIVFALLFTSSAGPGSGPLVAVAVAVAYMTTVTVDRKLLASSVRRSQTHQEL